MTERFVLTSGTISIDTGESTIVGTGTTFRGIDVEAAEVWVQWSDKAAEKVGTVAAVSPRGVYENLSLPLVSPWRGDPVVNQPYELIYGPAMANGASQAAILARYTAAFENNIGGVGNKADVIDYSIIPNNTLIPDAVTRTIYQWRNGTLNPLTVVGTSFIPSGDWADDVTYDTNSLVQRNGIVFVSNEDGNIGNEPITSPSPASDSHWTLIPLPATGDLFAVSFFVAGRPSAGELVARFEFVSTVAFADLFAGAGGSASAAAAADAAFSICKVVDGSPVEVGTIAFAEGESAATFTGDAVTFDNGDVMEIYAPDTPDATLEDIAVTLKGLRDGAAELDALPIAGGQMQGSVDFAAAVSVASATSTPIGAAASNLVNITGTTAITSFDTVGAGVTRLVKFAGALTLTHDGTKLILPGAADIPTAANDTAIFVSLGSGNWICWHYKRASGKAIVGPAAADITDATANGRALLKGVRGGDIFKMPPANLTGANSSSAQPWFPESGKSGAVAVAAATTYYFEGVLRLSRAAGTTSHTTGILFGGSATLTSIDYFGDAKTGDANDLQSSNGFWASANTELTLKAASTSTTEQSMFRVRGILRVNAAGTLIPQFKYSAAPGGAPTILRGSYFRMFPVGDNTVDAVGTWT
jgi:hypothetical protein